MRSTAVRLSQATFIAAFFSLLSTLAFADASHGKGPSIGESADASDATRTVNVVLGDIFYEPKTIRVEAGETVRFVLTNKGKLLHEFNIGTAAMHAKHQKEMKEMMESGMLTATGMNPDMSKMDHSNMGGNKMDGSQMDHSKMGEDKMDHSKMSESKMDHDDPNSLLVDPGKTGELVWKFTDATELEFACNLPGHYEAGMVGQFQVGH